MKPKTLPIVVEHAATGFLMPEATAHRIDALARGLPRDFSYRRRSAPAAELELDPGERTDVSTITTDALDRDRECVLPAGGDWSAYNRVVPFAHDYRQLPAGSCWWIKPKSAVANSRLIAKTHYPAKPADWGDAPWLPSAVLHLMQQPVPTCTGKSIGFLPLNIREANRDEIARRPELKGVPIIDRWAGIEYSVVPVPCNPEAEMLAVAKGVEAGVFDATVADLIAKAMTPFLDGWRSPMRILQTKDDVPRRERETVVLSSAPANTGVTSPSPGTPGEGGGEGLNSRAQEDPHPTLSRITGRGDTMAGALVGSALRTNVANAGETVRSADPTSKAVDSGNAAAIVAPSDARSPSVDTPDEAPMPPCPQCGTALGVSRIAVSESEQPEDGATYVCDYCGSTFAAPVAQQKAASAIHLHQRGYARAEALIAQGKLTDAPWAFTAEDRRAAAQDDFLAVDDSATPGTEAHLKYPVIKRGEVYRRGVAAAESRASMEGEAEIAEAAHRLMQVIHIADAAAAKAAEIERAASAPFVRPETIRAAIRRAVEDARAELPMLIRAELKEAYARATGKV